MSALSQYCNMEKSPLAADVLPEFSSFLADYLSVVKFALEHCRNEVSYRRRFNMPPEPYSANYDEFNSESKLFERAITFIEPDLSRLQWLYASLCDSLSKYLLLTVLTYRAIGWKYVSLPLDNSAFWDTLSNIGRKWLSGSIYMATSQNIELRRLNIADYGYDVELYTDPFGVFNEFIYSQYVYRGESSVITPGEGDCVIDCGACFGGTSLFFADRVGESGKVFSFEFVDQNIEVFAKNLGLNPRLSDRIQLVKNPVWSESGVEFYIRGTGPGASLSDNSSGGGVKVVTYSIDDLVKDQRLKKVGLIKMDVEGSEMSALRGAKDTILKYRPHLAISVYHRFSDFYEVPMYLKSLHSDYNIYMQHSTVHGDETVVFAL